MNITPVLSFNNNFTQINRLNVNKHKTTSNTAFSKTSALYDTISFSGNENKDPILFDGKSFSQICDGKAKEMFDELGIRILNCKDGFLTISHYGSKLDGEGHLHRPTDFEINENELFKYIKKIQWDAKFSNSQVTSLGNLESIGGVASFCHSQVTSLGNLERIGGRAYFDDSKITSLNKLKFVDNPVSVDISSPLIQECEKREIPYYVPYNVLNFIR